MQEEKIVKAAYRHRRTGERFVGSAHPVIYGDMLDMGVVAPGSSNSFERTWQPGFVTDRGRFITRFQAMKFVPHLDTRAQGGPSSEDVGLTQEGRDDLAKLPVYPAGKQLARKHGLKAMMNTDIWDRLSAVTNKGSSKLKIKDVGVTVGRTKESLTREALRQICS